MASSNSIKVVGTLEPNSSQWPIIDINDAKGGLHSVDTRDDMYSINRKRLRAGMLCYVIKDKLYYKYTGSEWVVMDFGGGGGGESSPGLIIATSGELDPESSEYNPSLFDITKVKPGQLIYVQPAEGEDDGTYRQAYAYTDEEGETVIGYNDGMDELSPGLSNIVTQKQLESVPQDVQVRTACQDEEPGYESIIEDGVAKLPICSNALEYFDAQYHKLFKWSYATSVTITPSGTTIDYKTGSFTQKYKATFTATRTYTYPTEDGSTGTDTSHPVIVRVNGVPDGWTLVSGKTNEYEFTLELVKDNGDYKQNKTVSVSGKAVCMESKEGSSAEPVEKTYSNATASIQDIIRRPIFYFDQISNPDEPDDYNQLKDSEDNSFDKLYETAQTLSIGKHENMPTYGGYLYIASTSNKLVIKQDMGPVFRLMDGYIDSEIGRYYVYKSYNMMTVGGMTEFEIVQN